MSNTENNAALTATAKQITAENKKMVAAAIKQFTAEQQQVLQLLQQNGFNYDMLYLLFGYIGKVEMQDFVTDMDIHIQAYLGATDSITDSEVTALYKLYSLTRLLANFTGKM